MNLDTPNIVVPVSVGADGKISIPPEYENVVVHQAVTVRLQLTDLAYKLPNALPDGLPGATFVIKGYSLAGGWIDIQDTFIPAPTGTEKFPYKYTITAVHRVTGSTSSLDPIISNEPKPTED